jgi:hypothetical protein
LLHERSTLPCFVLQHSHSINALLDDFPGASNESLAQTASLAAFLNGSNDPTDALSIGRSVYFPGLAAANTDADEIMRDTANNSDNEPVHEDEEMGVPAEDEGMSVPAESPEMGKEAATSNVKPSTVDPNAPTSSLTGNSPAVLPFSSF